MFRYLESWRAAVLYAAIISATALTIITDSLSLIHSLSFYPVAICWLILTIIAFLKVYADRRIALVWPHVNFETWSLNEKRLLGIILFIMTISALTAAGGVPNTWDSMTYHLPRVAHWIQDQTVGFYPTNIIRQLYITPWAEYAIAHVYILGGGEKSANFVQWASMVGSLIGVSLIAGQLGAKRLGQLMSAAIAACLPMGILQSVSTQTDYVCALWLTIFVFFLIENFLKFTTAATLAAGLSLGLSFLTKGYSYVLSLPFLILFLGVKFKGRQFSQALLGSLLMIICAMSLNISQYYQNTQAFGSPLWSDVSLVNGSINLKVLWVNLLRNVSIQLATPWKRVNENMKKTDSKAAGFLGANINDPSSSFGGDFAIERMNLNEDYSGNFFHTLLFMIVFIGSCFYRGPEHKISLYVFTVMFSLLLFCLFVRFQPWHSRFHLSLFILFCPVAGVILEHFLGQKSLIIGFLLWICALPWLFLNIQHPWFGNFSIWSQTKSVQYFYKHLDLMSPYMSTAKYVQSTGCHDIGLLMGEDGWEYPWWVLLAGKGVRMEHMGVSNKSANLKYPLGDFQACAIIVLGPGTNPIIRADGSDYHATWKIPAGVDKITVFLRKL